ncbi:MAG TPA: 23S rRNA pseudouridine synthase F [Clostridiales bacterium UBA8960]|nr:23S rRNA pseudouridine synthase F [Clostridiales bacterium UBA8960]
MRLNKFLSEAGVCSRREADRQIEAGKVSVNGVTATLGTQVSESDEVIYDGKVIQNKSEKVVIIFNKPVGIECTSNLDVKDNIIRYLNLPIRVFPVGRLDKNSEGLILLTNDGDLSNGILKARYFHEKEYIVTVNKTISKAFINRMGSGVEILETVTRPCEVEKMDDRTFRIILTQGLNRQIRRMCEALDYEVVKLKRIRVLNIVLGDLRLGKWRYASEQELDGLRQLVSANSDVGFASQEEDSFCR